MSAILLLKKIFGSANDRTVKKYLKTVDQINHLEDKLSVLSDEELIARTEWFKRPLGKR